MISSMMHQTSLPNQDNSIPKTQTTHFSSKYSKEHSSLLYSRKKQTKPSKNNKTNRRLGSDRFRSYTNKLKINRKNLIANAMVNANHGNHDQDKEDYKLFLSEHLGLERRKLSFLENSNTNYNPYRRGSDDILTSSNSDSYHCEGMRMTQMDETRHTNLEKLVVGGSRSRFHKFLEKIRKKYFFFEKKNF